MSSKKNLGLTRYMVVIFSLFFIIIGIIILTHKINMYMVENDYSFKLIGNEEMVLLEGEEYFEPGVKVLSRNGMNLSKYVNKSDNIDVNKIGTYEVNYDIEFNGISKNLTRKV